MSDTENTSEENALLSGEELTEESAALSCGIYLELDKNNNITFNVVWDTDEDLVKLATMINAITTTDFIMNQIAGMDTQDQNSIALIQNYVSAINSTSVISPLEVCKNAAKND